MAKDVFELFGTDKVEYFENDDDIEVKSTDRVLIEVDFEKKSATWMIVPQNENPANYVPEDDDFEAVIFWLVEHDFSSPEIIAARKAQLGTLFFRGEKR